MSTTLKVFLVVATVVFALQRCNQYRHHASQVLNVFIAGAPLLTYLSRDWSYSVLEQALDPESLKGNEDRYRDMLERVAWLGKWQNTCDDVQRTSTGRSWEIPRVSVSAFCQFENGEAKISMVGHKKPRLIEISIERSHRSAKSRADGLVKPVVSVGSGT